MEFEKRNLFGIDYAIINYSNPLQVVEFLNVYYN